MNRTESPKRTSRTGIKTHSAGSTFEKILSAFDTGGLTYSEVLAQLTRLLGTSASPSALLEILKRREMIEPLPEYAHAEVFRLLNDAVRRAQTRAALLAKVQGANPKAVPNARASPAASARTSIPVAEASGVPTPTRATTPPSQPSTVEKVVPVDAESVAAARARALAEELAAARTALESEQRKMREKDKALAESIASADAARSRSEEALRESRRYQAESRTMRDSLATRDAELAALQQEHAKIVPALEARAKTDTQLEVDLQAARARADALSSELKAAQKAVTLLDAQLKRSESHLDASRTEVGAVKTQSGSYLELLRTREWRRGFRQNMLRELGTRADTADRARSALQNERDRLQAQVASLQTKLEGHDASVDKMRTAASVDAAQGMESQAVQKAEMESAPAARIAQTVASAEPREPELTALVDDSVALGDVLMDRYRLVALIGEGGMSRVFKATDLATPASPDSFIAVKVLTRPFIEDSESFSSFEKLRGLAHPNIVRIFDCDRDGSIVFVTMEYLDGQSLFTTLRGGAGAETVPSGLDRDQARTTILTIADALDYAHHNDIVHGNLKPGNVIVSDRSEIKVIDFEMASWVTGSDASTPADARHYASPQLLAGQKPEPVDDVYALACMAYELLTGNHPYDAGAGAQSLKVPPRRRTELSAPQYSALVHGLQPERENRTATVKQFVAEFSAPERGRAWKSGTNALRAIGLSVVLVLAAVAWFLLRSAPVPPPAPAVVSLGPSPGTVIRDCATCPAMTVLPAGRFKQGSASDENGTTSFEKPLHWVAIGRPLAMSMNAVTVDEFQEFIAATGRDMQGCNTYEGGEWKQRPRNSWKTPGFVQTGAHPVTCASWNDATAYAGWLSTKTGHQYRLPSASEWEYAARAGGEAVQPWDPDPSGACAHANVADESAARRYPGWTVFACDDGYIYTAPVGSFKANSFGLNDMLGNVFQWTQDCWQADYAGAPVDGSARMDADCAERELRGGSWFSTPAYVRADYRNHFAADYRTSSAGIRLVRDIAQ